MGSKSKPKQSDDYLAIEEKLNSKRSKTKMKVSGKSVLKLSRIIKDKSGSQ